MDPEVCILAGYQYVTTLGSFLACAIQPSTFLRPRHAIHKVLGLVDFDHFLVKLPDTRLDSSTTVSTPAFSSRSEYCLPTPLILYRSARLTIPGSRSDRCREVSAISLRPLAEAPSFKSPSGTNASPGQLGGMGEANPFDINDLHGFSLSLRWPYFFLPNKPPSMFSAFWTLALLLSTPSICPARGAGSFFLR